ncbi:DUF4139 domain-containing protein [Desulfoplanes sp.]
MRDHPPHIISVLCSCLLVFCNVLPAAANVSSVTLFPDSATVEEHGEIAPNATGDQRTATILLPGRADPASLAFFPPKGVSLTDVSQKTIVSVDSEQIARLKKERENLISQKGLLEAQKKGLGAKIAFWESCRQTDQGSLDGFKELAQTMGKEIKDAQVGQDVASRQLTTITKEIARIQERIAAIQGTQQKNWKITLGFSPGPEDSFRCTWTYTLRGCGWKPIYRIEALPAQKKVRFTWQAMVHQGTGMDWKNVRLSLATGKTHTRPTPPGIRPWILQPREPAGIDSKSIMLEEAAAPRPVMQRATMAAPNRPVEHRKGTFSSWELGSRNIPAGDNVRVRVKDAVWPASFTYLLRPSVSGTGFLHTGIEVGTSLDLPRGEAMFLVDGAFLRKQRFSFSGKKLDLFFGPDPLVTAKAVLKDKKSGSSGVFSQKKTWTWDWDLIITNDKPIAIETVVEEPRPISRDKEISLSVSATPDFGEKKDKPEVMVWSQDLAPGTKQRISVRVEAKAPDDMNVDPGWRW